MFSPASIDTVIRSRSCGSWRRIAWRRRAARSRSAILGNTASKGSARHGDQPRQRTARRSGPSRDGAGLLRQRDTAPPPVARRRSRDRVRRDRAARAAHTALALAMRWSTARPRERAGERSATPAATPMAGARAVPGPAAGSVRPRIAPETGNQRHHRNEHRGERQQQPRVHTSIATMRRISATPIACSTSTAANTVQPCQVSMSARIATGSTRNRSTARTPGSAAITQACSRP